MSAQAATPGEDLRLLVLGYRVSQAISLAAELGIADLLAGGPRTADDLASAAGAHGPSLYRVLRLLASEGVFAETEDGRFELTPMAAALRRDAPGPVRALALQIGQDAVWRSWGSLSHAVRTGGTASRASSPEQFAATAPATHRNPHTRLVSRHLTSWAGESRPVSRTGARRSDRRRA